MNNFIGKVEVVIPGLNDEQANKVQLLCDYSNQTGITNIEELLAYSLINDSRYFNTLADAVAIVINSLSLSFYTNVMNGEQISFYPAIANKFYENDCEIICFNYDLVLERILWSYAECNVDYLINFSEDQSYGAVFDEFTSKFDDPETILGPLIPENINKRIRILKPHGSVSWAYCSQCGYLLNRYKHLIGHLSDSTCPNNCGNLESVIIPPTPAKEELFKRYPFLDQIKQEMIESISTAETIIIGGYSLPETDTDFRQTLRYGVEKNSGLKELIIINPDVENENFIKKITENFKEEGIPLKGYSSFSKYIKQETQIIIEQ